MKKCSEAAQAYEQTSIFRHTPQMFRDNPTWSPFCREAEYWYYYLLKTREHLVVVQTEDPNRKSCTVLVKKNPPNQPQGQFGEETLLVLTGSYAGALAKIEWDPITFIFGQQRNLITPFRALLNSYPLTRSVSRGLEYELTLALHFRFLEIFLQLLKERNIAVGKSFALNCLLFSAWYEEKHKDSDKPPHLRNGRK